MKTPPDPNPTGPPSVEFSSATCADTLCGCSLDRRTFLERVGKGAAALAAVPTLPAVAGPFSAEDFPDHHVPANKKLNPDWVRGLTERGERTWYTGDDLLTIGMPVGGVCAGQVYLSGEGKLIYWDIFNRNQNTGYGAVNYKERRRPTETVVNPNRFEPALDIDQGFAVRLESVGEARTATLDRSGFSSVRFCGEYPMAFVEYRDSNVPVEIDLEACSPFVPLDAEMSSLPATVLRYTMRNRSDRRVTGVLAGWLENRVCPDTGQKFQGKVNRVNTRVKAGQMSGVFSSVRPRAVGPANDSRPPLIFADFEQGNYGAWEAEGEAFGTGPASGTLEQQNPVSGFAGKGLVNTFLGGSDAMHGRLASPEFTIDRPWISFLVGGGAHKGRTCMNLVVNGKVARTVTGRGNERLMAENWSVAELRGERARLEIVDRESSGWGHINIDQIEFRDEPKGVALEDLPGLPDYGTMGLSVLDAETDSISLALPDGGIKEVLFAADGLSDAGEAEVDIARKLRGALGVPFELGPGESRTITFAVTWHYPNLYRGERRVENAYARRFKGAADVARHLSAVLDDALGATRLWHDTYYESTLPWWLLDRLHSTVSTLATATCQWWEEGRFWAYEGCGCCHGTCGHVWNYEHALARLFPDLERSVRERQDFAAGVGFNEETGSIGFRGEGWGLWAGDSQGGYILKAYREHLCSTDAAFLERNWPRIRQAVEFLIREDGNEDGLLEGRQHQTYDQDYYGANTFVGALYLGALKAAQVMAEAVGEEEFAARCGRLAESGGRLSMKRLFNGEYFIQQVDLKEHPDWQYGEGCLADQMFGQGWAHQVGLGHLYPAEAVRQSLESIWTYCWTPDVGPQNKVHAPERWFARPGEAGLLTCTWPKGTHLGPKSTRYRDEVWTGIEYQVANHMIWEGMVTEGLAICRAIHERYHPSKRNPWNEIECGDHYARGMASWGVLVSLAGFEYDGPAGKIGFAPRLSPGKFRSVFTAAAGWGSYEQRRQGAEQRCGLELAWGELRLRELQFAVSEGRRCREARVTWKNQPVSVEFEQVDESVRLVLREELLMQRGDTLQIVLR